MPETGVSPSGGRRRDACRVGCADDVSALRRVGDAQRDPQVRVRADLGRHHAAGPLRSEQQVDAQRATSLRDVDQTGDEGGQFPGERGELVDDQQQPGQRQQWPAAACPCVAGGDQEGVLLDVLRAGIGQDVLTPP